MVQILIITYQLNVLKAGNAPKYAMNWKRVWNYMKKQSVLTRHNTDILNQYWLKNRYGKIRNDTEYFNTLMTTKDQVHPI